MMKRGFTLIEIVVAVLISSMFILSLYQIYRQIQRSVLSMQAVVDMDMPILGFYAQLERDLTGAFVPQVNAPKPPAKKETKPSPEAEKKNQKPKPAPPKETKQKKIEPVFSVKKEGDLLTLNFVTTAGLRVTDTKGVMTASPYLRRVLYSLEKDPRRPGTFTLWYASSENLDPEVIKDTKKVPRFELAWGIKRLDFSAELYEPEKKGEKKEKSLTEIKQFDPKEIKEKYESTLPAFVRISGELVDGTGLRTEPFVFDFALPAYQAPAAQSKEEEKKPTTPKNEPKKS